jgi:hypothetical protein
VKKMSNEPRHRTDHLQLTKTHFFTPLKGFTTENAETSNEGNSTETPGKSESLGKGRPSPIVLTSEANLISFQRKAKQRD